VITVKGRVILDLTILSCMVSQSRFSRDLKRKDGLTKVSIQVLLLTHL
jgi:hypothetical protein